MTQTLTPHDAVARYIAGGLTTASGMPALAELDYLLALDAPTRYGWGKDAAAQFDAQLPAAAADAADSATVDDLPKMRPEAQAYLIEVSQGFPFVGQWHWTMTDVAVIPDAVPATTPSTPTIVSVTPPVAATPDAPAQPASATVQHGESFIEIVDDDVHALFAKVAAFFRSVGAEL